MLNRFFMVVIVVPLAVVLIALAVANREFVPFTMDPFDPGNPALTIQMPFFIYLFLALVLGVLIGSSVTWFKQSRYRKLARQRGQEVDNLRVVAARRPEAQPAPANPSSTALARTGT